MSFGRLLSDLFRSTIKGFVGEKLVAAGAKLTLPSSSYERFHNVTLPTADGTTQIDRSGIPVSSACPFTLLQRTRLSVCVPFFSQGVRDLSAALIEAR